MTTRFKGLVAPAVTPRLFVRGPLCWNYAADYGLRDTFYDCRDMVRNGVDSGKMQLWRVNDDSWLVTEIIQDQLFVWCYQGYGLLATIRVLMRIAAQNHLDYVAFFCRQAAALRALRCLNPVAQPTLINGETLYKIRAESP